MTSEVAGTPLFIARSDSDSPPKHSAWLVVVYAIGRAIAAPFRAFGRRQRRKGFEAQALAAIDAGLRYSFYVERVCADANASAPDAFTQPVFIIEGCSITATHPAERDNEGPSIAALLGEAVERLYTYRMAALLARRADLLP